MLLWCFNEWENIINHLNVSEYLYFYRALRGCQLSFILNFILFVWLFVAIAKIYSRLLRYFVYLYIWTLQKFLIVCTQDLLRVNVELCEKFSSHSSFAFQMIWHKIINWFHPGSNGLKKLSTKYHFSVSPSHLFPFILNV